ncbi:extensin family protein [Pseudohoeflea suaedae]|nr:extensin family protein [Pseudohoeflea suaedae]
MSRRGQHHHSFHRHALVRGSFALAVASALLAGCSGDPVPPAEVPSLSPSPAPLAMVEPLAPAGYMMAPADTPPQMGSMRTVEQLSGYQDGSRPFSLAEEEEVQAAQQLGAPEGYLRVPDEAEPLVQAEPMVSAEPLVQAQPEPIREERVAYIPRIEDPIAKPQWAGGMPVSERNCRQQLKRLGVVYEDIPAVGNGRSCGIAHPVKLKQLSGGITIKPAATLNCQITLAFAQWVKNDLAPSTRARYLTGISSIQQMSSYSCRRMNNNDKNPPMSEHAVGNAIDIGSITLNSGKLIDVRKPGFFAFREKSLLTNVRSDSCKYFNTVLGPGTNRQHADHFHFDLRDRKSGRKYCNMGR